MFCSIVNRVYTDSAQSDPVYPKRLPLQQQRSGVAACTKPLGNDIMLSNFVVLLRTTFRETPTEAAPGTYDLSFK